MFDAEKLNSTPPTEVADKLQEQRMHSKNSAHRLEWMMSHENTEAISLAQSTYRIRKIKHHQTKRLDTFDQLRNTRFGLFYSNRLKQYAVVRLVVQWLWRNGYPIYVNHISPFFSNASKRRSRRWRPLIKLGEFARKKGTPICKLLDESVIETPEPKVFPSCDQGYIVSPHERYKFPEIYVATIRNGIIYGGSNLIMADGKVICHDLYNFESDYTSEELHGRTLIDPKSNRIRLLLYDEEPERIPSAAAFVDACAPNYAHWLTEVLPRICLFCSDERFKNIPIVVNEGLHKNIMESLLLVSGYEREVILLPIGRALRCDKLYITSVSGYVPFEWRKNRLSGFSHGLFSPMALRLLCKQLNGKSQKAEDQKWPEKIFLRRNSGYRKVINAIDVERVFFSRGYAIVEPEKLSFSQQVALFKNAKTIVSSSGAALANMIFTTQGSKIFILISKHPDTIYWYWQNIACASGKTVNYLFGKISESDLSGIHASFVVDLDDLVLLLSEAEE